MFVPPFIIFREFVEEAERLYLYGKSFSEVQFW
jgi:hypothetical protein